jgi:hypothetical protein
VVTKSFDDWKCGNSKPLMIKILVIKFMWWPKI